MSNTILPNAPGAIYRKSRGSAPLKSVPDGAYLSTAELGCRLRFHTESVRRMIRQGRLPAVRIGKRFRVLRTDIEEYEAAHRVDTGARNTKGGPVS